ncbi:MAG TPA: CU044_5270 family protein [Gaiellaceae bacterium]|nr:CU044_5270 family protein [Gaiellaceae bacterium]
MTDEISFPPLRDLSPRRHEARKQHLLGEIARTTGRGHLSGLTPPFRLCVVLPAVAVTGAAVAAAVITLLPAGSGGPGNAAAAVLDRLAQRVVAHSLTPKPGQYLFVGSEAENAAFDESQIGACETLVPDRREIWIGTDGSGLIRETYGPGRWVNRAVCMRMEQKYGPSVRWNLARHASSDWYAPQCLSLKPRNDLDWSSLSSDPQVLLQQITKNEASHSPGEEFSDIEAFLHETDAPPGARAKLLRAVAVIPGVQLLGAVRDHDGRPGIGFSYPKRGELIFDSNTGELLGEEGSGGVPGSWTVYLRETVVDDLPGTPPGPLHPPCTNGGGVSHDVPGGSVTNGAPLKSG